MTVTRSVVEGTAVEPGSQPLERLRADLERALRFHEERLRDAPAPDDISMATYRRSERTRDQILEALSRMVTNTFGFCETCHQSISLERIEAMPHTRHCVACAERSA